MERWSGHGISIGYDQWETEGSIEWDTPDVGRIHWEKSGMLAEGISEGIHPALQQTC